MRKFLFNMKQGLYDPWTWVIAVLVWMAASVLVEATASPEWKHFWHWPFG